ncbi:uncharacterized protein [Lolium perenne]|uniref:uncharacterized protein n=1 Tax=Lolium perenne TaxID=4522 RepID=UPI0021F68689|nr:uncharacterized protein LOC127334546 [Lolium perenne]XP_051216996.1 uncharacterized protein LOC127334546 [Lolium perenne]XP_051216997.1 uncharacterized protein LOC127334546 [Lolium perenne]
MQYHHHRSRLPPPPPPPFGRGGGAVYPRSGGHMQLYAPPPPPRRLPLPAPPPPPPPHRRHEVLMEAGRLAAEYLVSTGALPPSSLQRGGGDAWAVPPPPPPPPLPQQLQEPPAFYGRRRYDDAYSNNPATRPRRSNSTSSSSNTRDNFDYSNGGISYNGRGKRKYGEYRRGHLDWGREREQEKGRSTSNGRRYEEDNDDDGAPGFRMERRGNDEARSCVTEEVKEATPSMAKAVTQLEMEDIRSNGVSSNGNNHIRKDADAQEPEVQSENEDGDMEENKVVLSSESEMVDNGMATNGHANAASTLAVMEEAEAKLLLDGKVVDEEAQDNGNVSCGTSLDPIALDDDMANLENGLHFDSRSLLKHCDFAKAPTKPRSVRPHRKAATETVDPVSSGEGSQMVVDEAANERSLTNTPSDNREDQTCQENTGSSTACSEIMEPTPLQEKKTSVVAENMREDSKDAQLHVVQESKEETDVSPLTTSHKDSSMKENELSPLAASCKDGLMQETNLSTFRETLEDSVIEETDLSPLIDSHNESLIEEAGLSSLADPHNDNLIEESDLSPLAAYHEVRLMQETDLHQVMSLHEDNLNLQFKEGAQICDTEMLPEDVDLIELSGQKNTVGVELFTNAETKTIIKMEEEKLDQPSSFRIHNNPGFGRSVPGSSVEPHKHLQEDFGARAGDNVSGTNNVYQDPLGNNSVQVFDIEDDTQIEVAGFDSSQAKNDMICSSMDGMMHPGIHTNDLPVIQDGYNLALSDYLVADIPCFTSMQPDLQASICANDSEGIPVMDDPIYGSLTDIGFLDVWGQPAEDFGKFF